MHSARSSQCYSCRWVEVFLMNPAIAGVSLVQRRENNRTPMGTVGNLPLNFDSSEMKTAFRLRTIHTTLWTGGCLQTALMSQGFRKYFPSQAVPSHTTRVWHISGPSVRLFAHYLLIATPIISLSVVIDLTFPADTCCCNIHVTPNLLNTVVLGWCILDAWTFGYSIV